MKTEEIQRQIRSLEDRRYQAMLEGDADTIESLLDEGLVYGHSVGAVDTKASYLDGVRSGRATYRAIERQDERVQVYGDTAVVSGRAHLDAVIGEAPRVLDLRYLAVWVKGPEGWKTVAFQSTPILS